MVYQISRIFKQAYQGDRKKIERKKKGFLSETVCTVTPSIYLAIIYGYLPGSPSAGLTRVPSGFLILIVF